MKPHRWWLTVLPLAVLFTVSNALKPLQVDDTAYYYGARQASAHPLDPYGFAIYWWYVPEPANQVLAPPVLPYWIAPTIRLFGEHPFLWKLWLLPFSIALVYALHNLFRRFAPGLETPLVWMTVLSPVVWPSFNLMLDIPALALGLLGLVLFMRAADRDSLALAALVGLVAGLSAQTKYTSFLLPAILLLYALLFRKLRLWAVATVVGVHVFVGWELLMALLYGESHFLHATRDNPTELLKKVDLAVPLLTILGALSSPVLVLALTALRARWWQIALAVGVALAGYGLVAGIDDEYRQWWTAQPAASELQEIVGEPLQPDHLIYGFQGALLAVLAVVVAWQLCRLPAGIRLGGLDWRSPSVEVFLVLWLALEVAGAFSLTTFPAARRVMSLLVVGTVVAGRLAARTCASPGRRRLIRAGAVYGMLLGTGFYLLDLYEARMIQEAAETGAAIVREEEGDLLLPGAVAGSTAATRDNGTVWYIGHWGFQYYAERAGMTPIVPNGVEYHPDGPIPLPPTTLLRAGDWVVLPDYGSRGNGIIHAQVVAFDWGRTRIVRVQEWDDAVPWRTVMSFYGGRLPLQHRSGPRREIKIVRVTESYYPLVYPGD